MPSRLNLILGRVLRVEPDEQGRVFAFMLLGALVQAGVATGQSAADSMFLVRLGASKLPIVYMAMPVLMAAYVPLCSWLLGRYGIHRIFAFTLGVLVAGGIGACLAVTYATSAWVWYAVKLYSSLWSVGLYSLFWTLVDGYFDLAKAKRLFGVLAAGPALGAIAGGMFVDGWVQQLGVAKLFAAWSLVAAASWPALVWIRRHYRPIADEAEEDDEAPRLGTTLRQFLASRFALVLAGGIFLTFVTATLCEYQYLAIFSASADESSLAELFGKLYAGVNVFNLCVSLFVFNTLVQRIGVRHVALVQPAAYLAVFTLLLVQGGVGAAMLGFLADQGFIISIDSSNVNLLFNGLPEKGRAQLRTLIEGLGEPVATAVSGVFLFVFAPRLSPGNLSATGFACAVAFLLLVLELRVDYARSMVQNVRRSWLDFTHARHLLAGVGEADLAVLEQRCRRPVAGERLTALRLLCANAPLRGIEQALALLPAASAAERTEALALIASGLGGNDPQLLLHSIRWSESLDARLDAGLLEELGRYQLVPAEAAEDHLDATDPMERAAAAALLWRSSRLGHAEAALRVVDELLDHGGTAVLAGIHGLGRMAEPRYVPRLLSYLDSPDPAVRLEVLGALRRLVGRESTPFVPVLLRLLRNDGTIEERQLVIELLGRIADSSCLRELLALADRFSTAERQAAERMIVEFGPRAVPMLINVAQSVAMPLFGRLIAVRALGYLAFPQLEAIAPALIEGRIERMYMLAGYSAALAKIRPTGPGLATLALVYRRLPELALEMVLEILSVTGRLSAYDSIVAALRAGSERERAYAIENIEQGCTRRLFAQLQPFLDRRPIDAVVKAGAEFGFRARRTVHDAIERSLTAGFPLEEAAALQALYEQRPADATRIALQHLRLSADEFLRATALGLLTREEGADDGGLTPIERIHLLAQAEFFRPWGMLQFGFIGHHVTEVKFEAGETVAGPTPGIHVIAGGGFTLGEGADARPLGPGDTMGEDALFGRPRAGAVRARSASRTLLVPQTGIMACARIYPQIALELLRRKLTAPPP